MSIFITTILISFALSILIGYPAVHIAKSWNLIDIPGSASHKVHSRPTPLAGGILIAIVLLLIAIIFKKSFNQNILAVLSASLIILFFGILDDHKNLSAGPKLLGQTLASLTLIIFGVQVHFMDIFAEAGYIPLHFANLLNFFITFVWLIGITNAVNLIDSMDGIVAGFGFITSVFFLGATNLSGQFTLSLWSAVLIGLCAGLYYWNSIATKFFLGDSGSQTIGFLLASFSILYNPLNRVPESSWIVPIMLLGIPIFDTSLVILSRLKRKQPISTGRRDHTYHRFIAMGLRPQYAVGIVHLATLIVSSLAFASLYLPLALALILFIISISIGLILLLWLEPQKTLDDQTN